MTIQRRLTLQLLAVVLALGGISGAVIYGYVRSHLLAQLDHGLRTRGDVVAAMALRADHNAIQYIATPSDLAAFRPGRRAAYFQIWRSDGTVFAASPSVSGASLPQADSNASSAFNLKLPNGRAGRAISISWVPRLDLDQLIMSPDDPPPPRLHATIAESRAALDDSLKVLGFSILLASLALAVGAAMTVSFTVHRGLRPLRNLAIQADIIGADSLHQRFSEDDLPGELTPIAARLNLLLGRLGEAFAREKRFSADVAHELRTPITELRALAEVSLRWPEEADAEQDRRETLAITARMQSIVNRLLAIARCEGGIQQVELEPIDLEELLLAAWRPSQKIAGAREVRIAWEIRPSPLVRSDVTILSAILENLLSNAATYAPPGDGIIARVTRAQGMVRFALQNHQHDLAPEDLEHLFDPFWRRDHSRTGESHSGLGLALVRAYASVLGIEVGVELPSPDVFCIHVTLPATKELVEEPMTQSIALTSRQSTQVAQMGRPT